MNIEQMDMFVEYFKNFDPTYKVYALQILQSLFVRDTLNMGEINLIFYNKKTDVIRKTVEELLSAQLIHKINKPATHHAEKRFKITNSGRSLIKYYNNHPF